MTSDDLGTMVSMWVCSTAALIFVATRIFLRLWSGQRFLKGDYWCMAAAVFITIRLVANHFLLLYGSTRTLTDDRRVELLQPGNEEEYLRTVTGSKIFLLTRTMLVCLLWCLKMAVLDILGRMISKLPYERLVVITLWITLASTFVASVLSVFLECRPFYLYYQVNPNPGNCVIGNLWLYVYEVSNIMTDALLMAIPIPLVLSVKLPKMQRLRILSLFSIGIFLIAVSIIRILEGRNSHSQRAQTLWASLEIICAAGVAVTPSIYALSRNRSENSSLVTTFSPPVGYGSHTMTSRIVKHNPKGDRPWYELSDQTSRKDITSKDGIVIETRVEVFNNRY
ncbi:hypothetical protein AB5N19_03707 [Seiridium cardinale]